jgi:hypothetical protein
MTKTDNPSQPEGGMTFALALAAVLAGVAMVASLVWVELSGSGGVLTFFFPLGGTVATGAAAIMGHRSGLTIKQVAFLVFASSMLGGFVNYGGYALWQSLVPRAAASVGHLAGTATAVLLAYLAGMFVRRGSRARSEEEIADTFG